LLRSLIKQNAAPPILRNGLLLMRALASAGALLFLMLSWRIELGRRFRMSQKSVKTAAELEV
jgi:hypothetical protein